ncbi:hypothetical protein [Streptomyces alkaliterrae]|uniref:Uncharacterized protein n=1 Tax=Streptomyces alkaliterrae TaxID=2213162 RepID=A0A5P0YRI0_9ACTN|nr:hypothetical protein [Streptomyces alkaliterrae]MBB1252372.1 hypothetical protein [Streptomyces alkaliterrae]MBB1257623.1 hypothetical protein [Streptomyces alkaliterrae]MQS02490.1 hypothetical protein [Streptomyces alkaliterrae]
MANPTPAPERDGPARRPPPPALLVLVAVGLLLTAPLALWWVVGQQTVDVPDPDFAVAPLEIPPAAEALVGTFALLGAFASAAGLVYWTRERALDPDWWLVIGPLLGAGLTLALVHRVVTAEVIGANIGAGLAILLGLPFAAILTLVGSGYALYLLFRRR